MRYDRGMDVPSPCTKVCRIDPAGGACEGCGRTLDEIAGWMGLTPERKRAVVAAARARLAGRPTEPRV